MKVQHKIRGVATTESVSTQRKHAKEFTQRPMQEKTKQRPMQENRNWSKILCQLKQT